MKTCTKCQISKPETEFINSSVSLRINESLKRAGSSKNRRHWEDLVGYTVQDLIQHLESQFKDGMN